MGNKQYFVVCRCLTRSYTSTDVYNFSLKIDDKQIVSIELLITFLQHLWVYECLSVSVSVSVWVCCLCARPEMLSNMQPSHTFDSQTMSVYGSNTHLVSQYFECRLTFLLPSPVHSPSFLCICIFSYLLVFFLFFVSFPIYSYLSRIFSSSFLWNKN